MQLPRLFFAALGLAAAANNTNLADDFTCTSPITNMNATGINIMVIRVPANNAARGCSDACHAIKSCGGFVVDKSDPSAPRCFVKYQLYTVSPAPNADLYICYHTFRDAAAQSPPTIDIIAPNSTKAARTNSSFIGAANKMAYVAKTFTCDEPQEGIGALGKNLLSTPANPANPVASCKAACGADLRCGGFTLRNNVCYSKVSTAKTSQNKASTTYTCRHGRSK
ncbi:Aste57867_18413 [Aphanomyces stellatus]|uniref:Aste57867_18413 protein n=1 Tax=Aphanomyces stellatus TaxID=120398 RepID=A0A485LA99_9STRA|nr:hypothetical protein As57867_018351 [Aphanomyces stellatus]VFT95149.1 Aste57867_18413 [Aphanomyces stellatus]